jgi:16S rRNA (adenine1518-N6/adenine1519-N6)-dimethyltransferase
MGRKFGQHFLVDLTHIQRIIAAIPRGDFDSVIEIGPGKGALTDALYPLFPNMHAVEIDARLIDRLNHRYPKAQIHHQDALLFDYGCIPGNKVLCIGNLPYEISSPLLFLLKDFAAIDHMIFMVQHEFAQRASSLSGRLGVMLQVYYEVDYLWKVPPGAFSPPPRVDSAMMRLKRRPKKLTEKVSELDEILRFAFSRRRKMLRQIFKEQAINFDKLSIDPASRPESLSMEQWISLAESL